MSDLEEYAATLAELELRAADPLSAALVSLTDIQRAYIETLAAIKLAKGGNGSGKTYSACVDFLAEAMGIHPTKPRNLKPGTPTWVGWWCTVSFPMLGLQTWAHFKRVLLYPGESVHKLPTRRILQIGWNKKSPETPNYLRLRGDDGITSEIFFLVDTQGREGFQSAFPNRIHVDEEMSAPIIEEINFRCGPNNACVSHTATPVRSSRYLRDIERRAERNDPDVFFARLKTQDNPAQSAAWIEQVRRQYKNDPERLKLRLEGYDLDMQGLVYSDKRFTREHVIEPFAIPGDWTLYRSIDDGFRHEVCLWFAVAPKRRRIVLFKEMHGVCQSLKDNCNAINGLSADENYANSVIDRASLQHRSGVMDEYGKACPTIELYRKYGISCEPSTDHNEFSGINQVWDLLLERQDGDGSPPVFQVFNTCEYFLYERENFMFKDDDEDSEAERPDAVVDRHNHAMDAWRYRVVAGLNYRAQDTAFKPKDGSLGHSMQQDRFAEPKEKPRPL